MRLALVFVLVALLNAGIAFASHEVGDTMIPDTVSAPHIDEDFGVILDAPMR